MNRPARLLPYALVALLALIWVWLAASLPAAANRTLAIDIACVSGNRVVGVWIEPESGGSGWASAGTTGTNVDARFTYLLAFDGAYEIRVGCGGTAQQWAVEARSSKTSAAFRRIICDDLHYTPPTPARCTDRAAG